MAGARRLTLWSMAGVLAGGAALMAASACTLGRDGSWNGAAAGGDHAGGGGLTPAGGGGSSSSSGTGAVGGGSGEDCLNGVDDDGDTAVDCDDPDCTGAGYTCVPQAPGAQGHVAMVTSPADCTAQTTATSFPACDACGCTANAGSCTIDYNVWYSPGCNGLGQVLESRDCANQHGSVDPIYLKASTTTNGDASCSLQAAEMPATQTPGCSLAVEGGHCGDGSLCLPPPFTSANACVLLAASSACPPGYPTGRQVKLDGSSCDCGCIAGSPACGTVTVSAHSETDCPAAGTPYTIDDSCSYLGEPPSMMIPTSVPGTISCAPTGMVTDATATATLCCIQ